MFDGGNMAPDDFLILSIMSLTRAGASYVKILKSQLTMELTIHNLDRSDY